MAKQTLSRAKNGLSSPPNLNHPVAEELWRMYHANAHQYEPTPSSLGIVLFNRSEVEDEGYDTSDSSTPPSRIIKTPTWTSAASGEDYIIIDPLIDYEGWQAEHESPACDSSEASLEDENTTEGGRNPISTPIYDEMTSTSKIQEFRLPEFKYIPRIEPQMQVSFSERRCNIPFEDVDEPFGTTKSTFEGERAWKEDYSGKTEWVRGLGTDLKISDSFGTEFEE